LIPRIACPLRVIQSGGDPLLAPGADRQIERAVASRGPDLGPSVCWTVPDAGHVLALAKDPEQYLAQLEQFLSPSLSCERPARTA
jgi:pimeloyl-ACP methyl ester carboxylesterase